MHKSSILLLAILAGSLVLVAACSKQQTSENSSPMPSQSTAMVAVPMTLMRAQTTLGRQGTASNATGAATASASRLPHVVYTATLHPLNSAVTGQNTTGNAKLAIYNGRLTFHMEIEGSAPGIEHWQNIHGFSTGKAAHCPTTTADTNGDNIIDFTEAQAVSGTDMVPLNGNPTAMKIAAHTYPKASANGSYSYQQTVQLKALQAAYSKKYKGDKLNLANSVIYVYGVPKTTKLPASVSGPPGAPDYTAIPIACGEINPVPQKS